MNVLLIGCAVFGLAGFGLGYWRGVVRGRAEGLLMAAAELLGRCVEVAKDTERSAQATLDYMQKGR